MPFNPWGEIYIYLYVAYHADPLVAEYDSAPMPAERVQACPPARLQACPHDSEGAAPLPALYAFV